MKYRRWWTVVVFAVAMAWVEAATVYYLRTLTDRIVPYQANPLPIRGVMGQVELVREAATLVMLFTVGMLAGRTWHKRLGYTAIAFGVWDIFYYVFLRLICDWPKSVFDWDILFLLPLPWWGPVLAPVCIALLMIVWGTLCQPVHGSPTRDPADVGPVGPEYARHRARAVRVHGRCASHGASRHRHHQTGPADGVQLVGVLGGARAHGCAGGAHWLATDSSAFERPGSLTELRYRWRSNAQAALKGCATGFETASRQD